MNVLSLFDGMSCGQIALNRLGIKYDNYFASEIDKYAIQVTQKNYPNTKQIGDVTQVKGKDLPKIDLLLGGSPCQGFSFAGKRLNFDDPRSALFFEFVRLLKETNPKYFLLENVRMKQKYQDVISEHLGVKPIKINSALVSAQNRVRFYWTNIPGIEQPEDKGIILKDILESGVGDRPCELKEFNQDSTCHHITTATDIKGNESIKRVYADSGKSPTLTTCGGGHREPKVIVGAYRGRYNEDGSTSQKLELRKDEKTNTITTVQKDNVLTQDEVYWRKLTPLECERLQTIPDNYTNHVSNTQRYKMLGNGWTVDVIAHIFKNIPIT